jgi:hypothetical protein
MMNLIFSLLFALSILLVYFISISPAGGYSYGLFSKDELPFSKPYEFWVAKWWNWTASIPLDPATNSFAGLKENGCFIHKEGPMVMLVDPAAGGMINQKCKISPNQAILTVLWSGECDTATKNYEQASFSKLSECARGYDLGKVSAQVKLDNIPLAKLETQDYTTNIHDNVTEIYTKEFNIYLPTNTHMPVDKFGVFRAAAHGWVIILKPLIPGTHTISILNNVQPTSVSGPGNVNRAQITYSFTVG